MEKLMPGASHSLPGTSHLPPGASHLVLSLFPGADLLGRGFESEGFCVVRGPDIILGQRIEDFQPCRNAFSGIIGGPPCQDFSRARRRPPTGHGLKMLAEFARVITLAAPEWWLMENVPQVPDLAIDGYTVQRFNLFASEFGLSQRRNRSFQFGYLEGGQLIVDRGIQSQFGRMRPAALASDTHRNFADLCELQGLPRDFDMSGLSRSAKIRAVGNGVPVPMARAIAKAIRLRSMSHAFRLCVCGCGRILQGPSRQQCATAACRKRMERRRSHI